VVDAANSGGQEVRVGEVFVECAGKTGFPGFGFFRQGDNCALRGRRRLPEEGMQLAGSKDGGWLYTARHPGAKMEIPVEEAQVSKSTEMLILREMLEAVIEDAEKGNDCYPIVGFASVKGSKWSRNLMAVGRFVNGWDDKWTWEDLRGPAQQDQFLEKILNLESLEVLRHTDPGLAMSFRRGAFWLTVRDVMKSELFKLGDDWDSKIVYSNLYRFGPNGGNPTAQLRSVQDQKCRELLAHEIKSFAPRRILLLTGWKDWAKWFLGTKEIPFLDKGPHGVNVERVGTISLVSPSAHVVVSVHPARKQRSPIVDDISDAFADLERREP
jgi:hypothetical protein